MSYSSTILADGPVGYWQLNDTSGTTAADSSGNNDPGTYYGGYTLDQSGPSGSTPSVLFNGSTGYVGGALPTSLSLTADWTMEVWVDPTAFANTVYADYFGFTDGSGSYITVGPTQVGSAYDWKITSPGDTPGSATTPVAQNAWSYAVLEYDSSTNEFSLWVNATLLYSVANGGVALSSLTSWMVGGYGGGSGYGWLDGYASQVAVYDKLLTSTQIQSHYAAMSSSPAVGTSITSGAATSSTLISGPAVGTSITSGATSVAVAEISPAIGSSATPGAALVRVTISTSAYGISQTTGTASGETSYTQPQSPITVPTTSYKMRGIPPYPIKTLPIPSLGVRGGDRTIINAFANQGMRGLWFKSSYCSCWGKKGRRNALSSHASQGNPECQICTGSGYLYAAPQTVYPTLFSKVVQQVSYDAAGQNPAGVAKWLVPDVDLNGDALPAFDRVSINDIVIPLDILYQAMESITKGEDALRRFPIQVSEVLYQGNSLQYQLNNNFVLVDLPPGSTYTVRYAYHPIYTIREEVGQARQFGGKNLPRTFHLLERAPISKTEYDIFQLLGNFQTSHAVI